jgi:hypothetical protein
VIEPDNNEDFECTDSVALVWDEVDDPSGIDRYQWRVEEGGDELSGGYDFFRSGDATGRSVRLVEFICRDEDTWYRWRVRAVDNAGNTGEYTRYYYFRINAAP